MDAAKVEAARLAAGLKVVEAALAAGIDQSTLARMENPRYPRSFALETVQATATALKVDIDALLAEEDAKRRGYDKPGLGPTGHPDDGDVLAELRALRAQVAALDRRFDDLLARSG